jgi:phage repressor protein C with HTH and peptisase S24 domain
MFSENMIENRIKQLREQNGLSASALAKIVGTSQPQITRLENGERPLDFIWLEKIAGALSVNPKDLIADTGIGRKSQLVPPPLPGHSLIRIIPVHGSVSAANGTIYGLADPDGSRKLYLDVPEDCYAVEVSGDSMEPRYQHGDKVLIHPSQTITKGMDVLIIQPDGEGMIKTYVGEKAGIITYRQYSPKEQEKTIKRADIEGMHAVICRWG